jgi:hypothetical protein
MPDHDWETVPQYEGSPYEGRLCAVVISRTAAARMMVPGFRAPTRSSGRSRRRASSLCPRRSAITGWWKRFSPLLPDKRKAQELVNRIRCIGVPGKWAVGIVVNGHVTYPEIKEPFKDYDYGFAEVLRWLRARQFDPYKYSDLHYRERLADRSDCCVESD